MVSLPFGARVFSLVLLSLFLGGCASKKQSPRTSPTASTKPKLTISPKGALLGRVVSINHQLNFLVLDFPPGMLPTVGQKLAVYHGPQKVGEIKVSGPQRDTIVVADITAGTPEVGDQVRPD